jgi:small subunit ribosomal protein S17
MAECNDKNCYVHGEISVRGGMTEGIVISDKGKRTVIVERHFTRYASKYKRFARERSKVQAHNPDCIGAKTGDRVKLGETRKISKTKAWTILEIVKGEK